MAIQDLATTALTTLTPLLLQGAGGIADGALGSIGQQLWDLVRQPFMKADHDKVLIEKFRQKPDEPRTQGAVEYQLQRFLEDQPALAAQLEALLDKAAASDQVKIINGEIKIYDSTLKSKKDMIIGGSKTSYKR